MRLDVARIWYEKVMTMTSAVARLLGNDYVQVLSHDCQKNNDNDARDEYSGAY